MKYCDNHGWLWDPRMGPSSCLGETLSISLGLGFLVTTTLLAPGSSRASTIPAGRYHRAQVFLSLLQAFIVIGNGVVCSRSRDIRCLALILHTLTWTLAWMVSAAELRRNSRLSKVLVWWWLAGAASNSVVLSSLLRASQREGHHLHTDIAALHWLSFMFNTILVFLQLCKPAYEDMGLYVVGGNRDRGEIGGWQSFWAGEDALDGLSASDAVGGDVCARRKTRYCTGGICDACFGCLRRRDERYLAEEGNPSGGDSWPLVGSGATGSLNDALLETSGLEYSNDSSLGALPSGKRKRGREPPDSKRHGCMKRTGAFFSSFRRTKPATDNGVSSSLGGHSGRHILDAPGAGEVAGRGRPRGGSSSGSYSIASRARAPPQAAAPVFGVSVTRWRVLGGDGIPYAQGLSSDAWADLSSRRWGNVSPRTWNTHNNPELSTTEAPSVASSSTNPGDTSESSADQESGVTNPSSVTVQFELAVRTSARGEMDWWGHGGESFGQGFGGLSVSSGSAPSTVGDWRVWRSAGDVLALYDALALRFGQEFCLRVSRPQLKTADVASLQAQENKSVPSVPSKRPAPHRSDVSRDARAVGGFLRTLLGLRQFLSTALVEFLAHPSHQAAWALESMGERVEGDEAPTGEDEERQSRDGSDEEVSGEKSAATGCDKSEAVFGGEASARIAPSTGESVAGAALASDYGAWLKRLAVRLRRATPAGERFVRLRRIAPTVTGEEVVRWLTSSSAECKGDRASAVRVGQDMVARGLLVPLCAGYTPDDEDEAGGVEGFGDGETEGNDLVSSFDDAAGWLFAYAGDALRNPFVPPPVAQIAVMTGSPLDVRVTDWVETEDDEGRHVRFIIRTQVAVTQEAWDSPRRYREFTQLRKRLLRLGVHVPTLAASTADGDARVDSHEKSVPEVTLAPDLPKKTWRYNKFDKVHLSTRRAALEAYLQGVVKVALASPTLAGHLVMRFLDPDESGLRILSRGNPFGAWSRPRAVDADEGDESKDYVGLVEDAAVAHGVHHVHDIRDVCDAVPEGLATQGNVAEVDDFESLTESLGGFG